MYKLVDVGVVVSLGVVEGIGFCLVSVYVKSLVLTPNPRTPCHLARCPRVNCLEVIFRNSRRRYHFEINKCSLHVLYYLAISKPLLQIQEVFSI